MSGSTPRGLAWSVVDTFGALTRREVSPAGRPAPKIRKRKETFATGGRLRHLGARAETVVVSLLAIWRLAWRHSSVGLWAAAKGSGSRGLGAHGAAKVRCGFRPAGQSHGITRCNLHCLHGSLRVAHPASEWRWHDAARCNGGLVTRSPAPTPTVPLPVSISCPPWFSVATADGS